MKQSDLNRAVARLTGESVRFVRQLGFFLVNVEPDRHQESACSAQRHAQSTVPYLKADPPSSPAA